MDALKDAAKGDLPLEKLEKMSALDDGALDQIAGGYYGGGKGEWEWNCVGKRD